MGDVMSLPTDNSVLLSTIFDEPEPDHICQRWRQRKVKNRWVAGACGNEPKTVLRIGPDGDPLPLCRECVAELARLLINYLV
jgi:hypothetical protein